MFPKTSFIALSYLTNKTEIKFNGNGHVELGLSGMRKGFVVYSISHPISALPFLGNILTPFAMCETSTNGGSIITRDMHASIDWI